MQVGLVSCCVLLVIGTVSGLPASWLKQPYDKPATLLEHAAIEAGIPLPDPVRNNKLFLGKTDPDYCVIGPSWWCGFPSSLDLCMVREKTIGVCGYNSKYTCKDNVTTVEEFCASNPKATAFNGGISGSPAGYFGYYALAMYWAPSSCPPFNQTLGGFCSDYTVPGNYAYDNLVMHGLWPDYGSLYPEDPLPPKYEGQYQGWPQFCDGPEGDYGKCAVIGDLCPWENATSVNFTQSDYEDCMRLNNITECLVPDETLAALGEDFKKYAPGYYSPLYSFMDHEFSKHGSCIGGYLSKNITAYYDVALAWAKHITSPDYPQYAAFLEMRGHNVSVDLLDVMLNKQAAPRCKPTCELEEVWYCLGRDASGFPTDIMECPVGTLASNSCRTNNCTSVFIPFYDSEGKPTTGSAALVAEIAG